MLHNKPLLKRTDLKQHLFIISRLLWTRDAGETSSHPFTSASLMGCNRKVAWATAILQPKWWGGWWESACKLMWLLSRFSSSQTVEPGISVPYDRWPETTFSSLSCRPLQHGNLVPQHVQTEKAIESTSDMKVTILCNLFVEMASAHLFHSLLVESESLGPALLKGREKHKATGPEGGDRHGPSEKPAYRSCLLEALSCND